MENREYDNWGDLLSAMMGDRGPMLVTTATTGLKEAEDQLIGVSLMEPGAATVPRTVIRRVPEELLSKGREYHRITRTASDRGVSDDELRAELDRVSETHTLFSYNAAFQRLWLSSRTTTGIIMVHNLPQLLKAAMSRQVVRLHDDDTMSDLETVCCRLAGNVPGFARFARGLGMEEPSEELWLPMERNLLLLSDMWSRLVALPASVRVEARAAQGPSAG